MIRLLLSFFICAPLIGAPLLPYTIVGTLPHRSDSFTQGLLFNKGMLYQSTGSVGRGSGVQRINPVKGSEEIAIPLATSFGEGIAVSGNEIVQLTWQDGVALRYSLPTLTLKGYLSYSGEGWGLTDDGLGGFWMSNGSASLIRRSAPEKGFKLEGTITVTNDGRKITQLNELERVGSLIIANVWYCDSLFCIDARSGVVKGVINVAPLRTATGCKNDGAVTNGIAWEPNKKELWLTGKLWPTIYKLKIPALIANH